VAVWQAIHVVGALEYLERDVGPGLARRGQCPSQQAEGYNDKYDEFLPGEHDAISFSLLSLL